MYFMTTNGTYGLDKGERGGEIGSTQLFYKVLFSVFAITKNRNIVQIQNVHNVVQSSLLIWFAIITKISLVPYITLLKRQCCGTGMFIPDRCQFLSNLDPGFRI